MPAEKIVVNYEWDTLREVVVGCPYARMGTDIPAYLGHFMAPASLAYAREALKRYPGKLLEDVEKDLYQAMVAQMDNVIRLLTARGIIVHQTLPFTAAEETFLEDLSFRIATQSFPRDPVVVIGNIFIETAMYAPYRRKERFAIRRTLEERLTESNARVVSMPEPYPLPEGPDGYGPGTFLEGGDVFLLDRDIYVGNTGNASSPEGMQWLQNTLGNGYRVHEIKLNRKFLHLDCVLATPRPGLAIVCRAAFTEGLPSFLDNWDLIDVSPQDAEEKLATNVLVIDQKTVIVAEEVPDVADALAKAGQDVLVAPFSAVFLWGGAFRCWHHPLWRET